MTQRSFCLFLAIHSTLFWSAPCWTPRALGEERKIASEPDPDAPARDRERTERIFRALSAATLEASRDSYDSQGVIEQVGRDPVKLFEWVRDQTIWVPYSGALRGPVGVLMDRMGNSLDRSLLLSRLLLSAGRRARLAHGAIPAEKAREILAKLSSIPARTDSVDASQAGEQKARAICKRFGVDFDELRRSRESFGMESSRIAEEALAWTEEQTRQVAALVPEPAPPPQAGDPPGLAELQDHWWVELEEQKEWRTLDALLPDAAPGWRAAEPDGTLEFDRAAVVPKQLEASCHTLVIRFIVEGWSGGVLQQNVALEKEILPLDVQDRKITLRHAPLGWPAALDLKKEKDPLAKFRQVILEQKEWLPIVIVGGERSTQGSFTQTGAVMSGSDRGAASQIAKGAKKALGGFGAALGGGESDPGADGVLTAEWIEYEIRAPGAPPRKIRREVFDLIGPAAREAGNVAAPKPGDAERLARGLAILDEIELLPLPCKLSPGYVEAAMARGLAAHQDFFLDSIAPPKKKGSGPGSKGEGSVPGALETLALARWSWSRDASTLYQDSLNLLAFHIRLKPTAAGEISFAHGFDIVANGLASRKGPTAESFRARLRQGILETQIESKLLIAGSEVKNTGEIMARSARQGIAWVAVRDAESPAWKDIDAPADVKSRMMEDLAAGFAVVAPRKAVAFESGPAFGWWRVHALTGETLGRMESGEGQSMTDKVITNMILFAPSAYAGAADYLCKKMGKSDGACHPCLIAAVGALGAALSFASGAAAFSLGEKSFVMWFGAGAYSSYSTAKRTVGCIDKFAGQ